jgi:hypothetical protein
LNATSLRLAVALSVRVSTWILKPVSILMVQKHHTSLFSIERFALPKSHQVGRINFMPGRYTVTGALAMWMVVYVATVALLSFAFIPALTIDE